MASSGISDERVWPETQELCDQSEALTAWERRNVDVANYLAHQTRRIPIEDSTVLNRDNETNHVPEGGYICEFDAQAMEVWYIRG